MSRTSRHIYRKDNLTTSKDEHKIAKANHEGVDADAKFNVVEVDV